MKRIVFSCVAAAALGASGIAAVAASSSATAQKPPPASTDPCASKPSAYQRMQCENFNHSAPGDEYFGRMKLSYLGINNTYHDATISAGPYTTDSGIISKVGFADEALDQWRGKYPGDPQLARSYYLAVQAHLKIYTQDSQNRAYTYMQLLETRFPTSYFAKVERTNLSKGFTEHWFANPTICPTPLPSGAVVENTPSATESPSPAPGQPKVEIIVPPCVPPSPTPSPEPSVTPSPSASTPAASPASSPIASPTGSPIAASPSPNPSASASAPQTMTPTPAPTATPHP